MKFISWGTGAVIGAAGLVLCAGLVSGPTATQAKGVGGEKPCAADYALKSSPGDHWQTVTVQDHAAMDVHVKWTEVHLVHHCSTNQATGSTDNSGTKTLLAAQSWSKKYDASTDVLIMTVYSDANKAPYCWENQTMDGSRGDITLTIKGTLFGGSCNGG